jgi:hypothetical protein
MEPPYTLGKIKINVFLEEDILKTQEVEVVQQHQLYLPL